MTCECGLHTYACKHPACGSGWMGWPHEQRRAGTLTVTVGKESVTLDATEPDGKFEAKRARINEMLAPFAAPPHPREGAES